MFAAVYPWRVSLGLEFAVASSSHSSRGVAIGTGSLCHEQRICFSWLSAVILVDFDWLDTWAMQARAYIPIPIPVLKSHTLQYFGLFLFY